MKAEEDDPLIYHAGLGYEIRKGSWREHQASTYSLAEERLTGGDFPAAERLGRYTVREALEAFELYSAWIEEIPEYLLSHGVAVAAIEDELARISPLLRLPDGSALEPAEGWCRYNELIDRFAVACRAGRAAAARQDLDAARQAWRVTHDRMHDKICFLLTFAARQLGEGAVGPLWDHLMAEMYRVYDRYDMKKQAWESSAELLMQIMAEALRGHLSGPGRRGDIEFVDEGHRVGFRFDPCGSGGRTYRPDPDDGVGPRMLAPYEFGVTRERHDWAWNEIGICYYCAHCCELMERIPIQKYGYPARVIDPPKWPEAAEGGKCTWWVYRDPRDVPEEVYARVGAEKPATLGSSGGRNSTRTSE